MKTEPRVPWSKRAIECIICHVRKTASRTHICGRCWVQLKKAVGGEVRGVDAEELTRLIKAIHTMTWRAIRRSWKYCEPGTFRREMADENKEQENSDE